MTIEMNYRQTIQQAEQLERLSERLKNVCGELEESRSGLKQGWAGEAADAYQRKGELLEEKISKEAEKLRQTAEIIRKMAQRTRKAELENIRLAEQRKNK